MLNEALNLQGPIYNVQTINTCQSLSLHFSQVMRWYHLPTPCGLSIFNKYVKYVLR